MLFKTKFALWPILPLGAEDKDEGSNTDSDNSGQSAQQSGDAGNQGNSEQVEQDKQEDDSDDPYKGLSNKELKRLLKDAEEKGTTVEQELKTLRDKQAEEERKKLSKEQALEKDLTDERAANVNLRSALNRQAIINAINSDKRYEWNSAEIVAQQLNSEKVKVDDNGKVSGIEKELARIASDESLKFLLRHGNSNNNDEQQNNGPTGFQPGQGGANSSGNGIPENAQELAKIMPALNSRI